MVGINPFFISREYLDKILRFPVSSKKEKTSISVWSFIKLSLFWHLAKSMGHLVTTYIYQDKKGQSALLFTYSCEEKRRDKFMLFSSRVMKCSQPHPGFELGLSCPFLMMLTIITHAFTERQCWLIFFFISLCEIFFFFFFAAVVSKFFYGDW